MNYPRVGRISEIEMDSAGVERYFIVSYKDNNKKKEKSVKRCAQSLVLLLKKSEDDKAKISDSLFWCPDKIVNDKKKRVKVNMVPANTTEIQDI